MENELKDLQNKVAKLESELRDVQIEARDEVRELRRYLDAKLAEIFERLNND